MPFVVKLFTSCMCVYRFSRHPKPRTKRISLPFLYPPPHFFFFSCDDNRKRTQATSRKWPTDNSSVTTRKFKLSHQTRPAQTTTTSPSHYKEVCVYLCACVLFDLCAHRIDTIQQKFETHKRKKERKRSLAIFAFFSSSGIKTSLWKGKVLGRRSEMIEPVFV